MIEHTRDFRRVKALCDFPIHIQRDVYYLIETDGKTDNGVWLFHPYQGGLMLHVIMTGSHRGAKVVRSCKNALAWVWDNTDVNTVHAAIPFVNPHARILMARIGFTRVDCDRDEHWCYKIERPQMERLAS